MSAIQTNEAASGAQPKSIARDESQAANDNRDLGFGSVVVQESRERFLNRDGTFNVTRVGLPRFSSINTYNLLLTISWRQFIVFAAAFYFGINLLFAVAYLLCGEAAIADTSLEPTRNQFLRAFFFSVETFATIGYGTIHPTGFPANFLMTLEAFVSIVAQAFLTGLLFARFSRPTAEIKFSDTAIVAPYQDKTALMFRIVNQRSNQLVDVSAEVLFARFVTENGKRIRKFDRLELERPQVSFMPLAWTIVHPIIENSPMFDCADEDLRRSEAEILIVIAAFDETFSQMVHTRSSYKPEEIEWNAKFADIYVRDEGLPHVTIDVRKLSETKTASTQK